MILQTFAPLFSSRTLRENFNRRGRDPEAHRRPQAGPRGAAADRGPAARA